jgi:hypothetical protein
MGFLLSQDGDQYIAAVYLLFATTLDMGYGTLKYSVEGDGLGRFSGTGVGEFRDFHEEKFLQTFL